MLKKKKEDFTVKYAGGTGLVSGLVEADTESQLFSQIRMIYGGYI